MVATSDSFPVPGGPISMEPYRFEVKPSTLANESGRFNYWLFRSDDPNWSERSLQSLGSAEEAAQTAVKRIRSLLGK